MKPLDKIFRKFTLHKLEALNAIVDFSDPLVSTTTISGVLTKQGQELGGTLSSLSRTKINGEPLIIPAGKSAEDGILWRINEKAAPKEEIKKYVKDILEENKSYRMATK